MKTHLARITVASALLLAGSIAEAQSSRRVEPGFEYGESLVSLNWEVSAPTGDLKDYISNWGLRGFSLEGRYMVKPRLSLGGSLSMNRWEQTNTNAVVTRTFNTTNATISGPVYRYADMFALRFLAHYYLMDGPIQPYIGAGIGGVWAYSYQQVVDLAYSSSGFNFIVDPEIGVLWQVMRGATSLHVNLAVRYTYTTASLANGGKDVQWWSLPVVGLAWSY